MKQVRKGAEPRELTTYRASPGARYDGDSGFPSVKEAVRKALTAEQLAVCCYCNQRVRPTDDGMRIEHREPQRAAPSRDLEWANLLAACCGNEGGAQQHCDVAKADTVIQLDPTQATHVATIGFDGRGRVTSTRADFQREIDDVLRLNCDHLVELRAGALDDFIRLRVGSRRGQISRESFVRWRDALDAIAAPSALPPFASYLRAWLVKQIARRKSSE